MALTKPVEPTKPIDPAGQFLTHLKSSVNAALKFVNLTSRVAS